MSANTESGAGSTGWSPANPAPLGLAAFGITTLFLSLQNSNLIGPNVFGISAVALAYGGIAQLLAGMWEFRAGNTFGAVAFSSFGAFWISFYVIVHVEVPGLLALKLPAAATGSVVNASLGAYLWVWAALTLCLLLCTFASARALSVLFFVLLVTFILLAIGNSGNNSSTIHAGGWAGIVTAAVALYIATAEIMKAQYGRWVLPIGAPAE